MKKAVILLIYLTLFTLTCQAQIEKKVVFIGASSGMDFVSNLRDEHYDHFNIAASAGYFPVKNLMLGIGGGYGTIEEPFGGIEHVSIIQVFSRYYFKNFFGSAGILHNSIRNRNNQQALLLQAGYAAFLNKHIAIEPSFNYGFSLEDEIPNEYSLHIGFGIYLNRE